MLELTSPSGLVWEFTTPALKLCLSKKKRSWLETCLIQVPCQVHNDDDEVALKKKIKFGVKESNQFVEQSCVTAELVDMERHRRCLDSCRGPSPATEGCGELMLLNWRVWLETPGFGMVNHEGLPEPTSQCQWGHCDVQKALNQQRDSIKGMKSLRRSPDDSHLKRIGQNCTRKWKSNDEEVLSARTDVNM